MGFSEPRFYNFQRIAIVSNVACAEHHPVSKCIRVLLERHLYGTVRTAVTGDRVRGQVVKVLLSSLPRLTRVFTMPLLDRITFDPALMGGRACIRGMRVTVALVLNLVANGMSIVEIIDAYPYLEPEDIRQALQYAAWLAEESVHPSSDPWVAA